MLTANPGSAPKPSLRAPSLQGSGTSNLAARSLWIDIVRGLAISLVALGHTNQGELSRNWWGTSSFGSHLNALIYAFHMPAFFFISGTLLPGSIARRGYRGVIAQKARTLLYPFLVWSVIVPVLTALLARFTSLHQLSLHAALLNVVTGNSAWFLPALFVSLCLATLVSRAPGVLTFVLALGIAQFWHPFNILAIDRGVWHLPFVLAGMHLQQRLQHLERLSAFTSLCLAITMAAVLYWAVCHIASPRWVYWGLIPAGFFGTALLLLLARSLEHTAAGRITGAVGMASLWVFLLAPFAQGAARAALLTALSRCFSYFCPHLWRFSPPFGSTNASTGSISRGFLPGRTQSPKRRSNR